MLERMWSKGNTPPLLVRMQTYTTTLEISMLIPQKIGNQPTSGSSNTTLGHIPKGYSIILQEHITMFIAELFVMVRTSKQPRWPSTKERIKKMWYIYTMEYYSVVKNNVILIFTCKMMELGKIIFSELTQTKKDRHGMYPLISGY